MPVERRPPFLFLSAAVFLLIPSIVWGAPKYKVLHSFGSGMDGAGLWSSLVFDQKGNLYGTTSGGGEHNTGIVFQLSPQSDGTWQEAVLYNFCSQGGSDCTDGKAAFGGPTLDSLGNIYGTTQVGGADGYGTIYELTQEGAAWTETVLHSFSLHDDGGAPTAGVMMDPSGNLYGVGGDWAFELSRDAGGWMLTGLHQFGGQGDGAGPQAEVTRDSAGNLYGTTDMGGGYDNDCGGGCGTVYRLHPQADNSWQETLLHDFGGPGDGTTPGNGSLIMDRLGTLYGTTTSGAIYKLAPRRGAEWKETVLYDIAGGNKGQEPVGGVVMDKAGILYGTTNGGGAQGCGVVYKLTPPRAKGKWRYTVLHTFDGNDGCYPAANLILDSKGNLYGTATLGGLYGWGVAFELTP